MDAKRAGNLGYFSHEASLAMPERIAMIDLTGPAPREVTYGELEERLNRAANLAVAMGLKPGDRLAMCVANRFEFIEIMYGAMRAGVVPVTLNTRLGAEVLEFTVRDSDSAAAIVEPGSNRFAVGACEAAGLTPLVAFDPAPEGWQDYETLLMAQPTSFEPPELGPDHPSFQPYTSGSTGKPKGVVLTHAGQLWGIHIFQRFWPEKLENRALAAVTVISQASETSKAPAMQYPCTAAMVGFGDNQNFMMKSNCRVICARTLSTLSRLRSAAAFKSNPGEKARPAPETTTTSTSSSAAKASSAAIDSCINSLLNAFRRSGRLNCMRPIPSAFSVRTSLSVPVIARSS